MEKEPTHEVPVETKGEEMEEQTEKLADLVGEETTREEFDAFVDTLLQDDNLKEELGEDAREKVMRAFLNITAFARAPFDEEFFGDVVMPEDQNLDDETRRNVARRMLNLAIEHGVIVNDPEAKEEYGRRISEMAKKHGVEVNSIKERSVEMFRPGKDELIDNLERIAGGYENK